MGGVCIFTSGYTYESVRMSIYIYYLCMYYRTRRTNSDGDCFFIPRTRLGGSLGGAVTLFLQSNDIRQRLEPG